ncbi:nucleotidyltransferase family protein [Paraglaciecola sp.]|uniref:nucleotidyltransferase family protein n=1 Tax=Paraglaciecola sp. TaxID=1920173 RepID=UPI003EF1742A
MKNLADLVFNDPNRMEALRTVRSLDLEQGYIAAGFLRNLVWDHLHNITPLTPLNDIDVIYFNTQTNGQEYDQELSSRLEHIYPSGKWQVKNQALMHNYNGDAPYTSVMDAMSYWPEKETAVAVRLLANDQLEFVTAFSLDLLYNLTISHNPARSLEIFKQRVSSKGWQTVWPKLKVKIVEPNVQK